MSIGTRGPIYTATNAPVRRVIAEAFDLSFAQVDWSAAPPGSRPIGSISRPPSLKPEVRRLD